MPRKPKKKKQGPPKFRSKLEQRVAAWLTANGIKFEYETVRLDYRSPVRGGICEDCAGTKGVRQRRKYLLDFWLPDYAFGIEVKGYLDSPSRTKYRDIKKCNPSFDLRFVFGSNNKLTPRRDARYSDWSAANGFDFAVGLPSGEWFSKGQD